MLGNILSSAILVAIKKLWYSYKKSFYHPKMKHILINVFIAIINIITKDRTVLLLFYLG